MQSHGEESGHKGMGSGYRKLAIALVLSVMAMYPLSMAFVAQASHFHFNLSNLYIALTMVAPMGIIMVLVMWRMFPKRAVNIALIAAFVVLFFGAWWLGRQQALVGNDFFLRAMIPHHSRAILVCQESDITDPDIASLCATIVETQREEIATMEAMLED